MRGTFKVAGGTSAASAGTDHVENQGLGAGVGRGEPVGVGGGVRRGGGVGRAAVVGLDLGVGVALGIGVAVDVGVAVAVPAGVSVALGVAVAVGVTVAVATRSHREPRCGNRDHRPGYNRSLVTRHGSLGNQGLRPRRRSGTRS